MYVTRRIYVCVYVRDLFIEKVPADIFISDCSCGWRQEETYHVILYETVY